MAKPKTRKSKKETNVKELVQEYWEAIQEVYAPMRTRLKQARPVPVPVSYKEE